MTRSLLNALALIAATVTMLVLTNYVFLERFGLGHTVPKVVGLIVSRSFGQWFAALVVCFAMPGAQERRTSREKVAFGSALMVPVLYGPITVLALLIAALAAAPMIGFVPRAFYEVLDERDFAHGLLAATFTASAPVALVYVAPANWSELALGPRLRWIALFAVAAVVVSQITIALPW